MESPGSWIPGAVRDSCDITPFILKTSQIILEGIYKIRSVLNATWMREEILINWLEWSLIPLEFRAWSERGLTYY